MNKTKSKKKVTSFRLSDQHKQLLKVSAYANNCSKTAIIEDALNNYYRLKR